MLAASVRSLGKLGPCDEDGGAVGDAEEVVPLGVCDGDDEALLEELVLLDGDEDAFFGVSFEQPARAVRQISATTGRIRSRCMVFPRRVLSFG
jgi:hypothetical protein